MEPRFLGVKAILSKSFARIHETNLKKQGMLALTFANATDYDKVKETDTIDILGLTGFAPGKPLTIALHHATVSTYHIGKSEIDKGRYTSISGNKAVAFGLIAAAEKAGLQLFLGSYPITPATDIMHELAARKDVGVRVVQSEDEIAGICTAIGASFAGNLAATSTSGPGLALKSEAIGLAVTAELPLVIVDVQRGGPSTGLPTKTEQADLLQALYGRNGECPLVVLAAGTPDDCFDYAYMSLVVISLSIKARLSSTKNNYK